MRALRCASLTKEESASVSLPAQACPSLDWLPVNGNRIVLVPSDHPFLAGCPPQCLAQKAVDCVLYPWILTCVTRYLI